MLKKEIMITEIGFYKVKYQGRWTIAQMVILSGYPRWFLTGSGISETEHEFSEIDHNRILMPDEKEDNV